MIKPTFKSEKTSKKTILALIVGAFLLFALLEIGLVIFEHYSKSAPDKSNFFFKDDMAVFGERGKNGNTKYGIVHKKGNIVVKANYEAALPLGEDRIGVRLTNGNKRKYAILSAESKKITDFEFDEIRRYSGKVIAAKKNGKWGYLDTEGKITIDYRFENVHSFSEGVASVEENGKWFFIDKKGNKISKMTFEEAGNLKKGLARVKKDGKWGYIDVNFNWLTKPCYDDARDFADGLAAVCKNGKWGFVDTKFKEVIEPRYKIAKDFKNGLAPVANDKGQFGYINSEGTVVIPFNENIWDANHFSTSNRAAVCNSSGMWNYINSEGTYEDKPEYLWAGKFHGSIAPVQYAHNRKYTFINIDMQPILEGYYPYISDFCEDGYCLIKNDSGRWFVINKKGIPLFENEYDELISGNDMKWFAR